jgi:hypothetical protein
MKSGILAVFRKGMVKQTPSNGANIPNFSELTFFKKTFVIVNKFVTSFCPIKNNFVSQFVLFK